MVHVCGRGDAGWGRQSHKRTAGSVTINPTSSNCDTYYGGTFVDQGTLNYNGDTSNGKADPNSTTTFINTFSNPSTCYFCQRRRTDIQRDGALLGIRLPAVIRTGSTLGLRNTGRLAQLGRQMLIRRCVPRWRPGAAMRRLVMPWRWLRRVIYQRFGSLLGRSLLEPRRTLAGGAVQWLVAFFRYGETSHCACTRQHFRLLRHEQLNARVMLQGTLYWDGVSAAWNSQNWYVSNPSVLVNWMDGSAAVFTETSQEISITIPPRTQVTPSLIEFLQNPSGNSNMVDICGGTLTNNAALTDNGYLVNSGTLTGSGTLTVTANAFIDNFGTLAGNIVVGSGSELEFCQTYNMTYSGVISGAGCLYVNCPGYSISFLNTETYTGTTYVSAGTLILGNGTINGSLASSTINVSSGAAVEFYENANETYTNTISGGGSLTDGNSKTITLSGNHSGFTGSKGTGIVW